MREAVSTDIVSMLAINLLLRRPQAQLQPYFMVKNWSRTFEFQHSHSNFNYKDVVHVLAVSLT